MLTVLYICTDVNFAGSSKSLYNMIEALDGRVCPIVLLSAQGEVYEYFTMKGIRCIVIPFFYLDEKPKKLKTIIHHPHKSRYYRNWMIDRHCVNTVVSILHDVKIDIVHTNTSVVTIGVDLARALKAKHVWHIREYLDLDHGIKVFRGRSRLKRLINSADARITITHSVCQYWGCKIKGTFVLNNAVRHKDELTYVAQKEKYFLFISAYLSDNKGTRFAIRAFAKSGLKYKGYKLKILGRCSNEYQEVIKEELIFLGLYDSVELLGFQKDVKEYYVYATAFLMTSNFEAMGRVTVDAMFYGCPVIARAAGGSLEIVKHEFNGYLFLTEEECAEYMNRIVSDVNESINLINNAMQYADEHFTVERYGNKIIDVYNYISNK